MTKKNKNIKSILKILDKFTFNLAVLVEKLDVQKVLSIKDLLKSLPKNIAAKLQADLEARANMRAKKKINTKGRGL